MDLTKIFLAAFLAAVTSFAVGQVDPMIDPSTGQSYLRGTAIYIPPGSTVTTGPITQADINAIGDATVRQSTQWQLNQAHKFQTQSDGIERSTDLNERRQNRTAFSP